MAMFPCPECGKPISTTGKYCPGCGARIRKPVGPLGITFVLVLVIYVLYIYNK
jgi:hypothetical protein